MPDVTRDVTETVGAFYDAVLEPSLWPGAVRGWAAQFHSSAAVLHVMDAVAGCSHATWAGIEPAFQQRYVASFAGDDPMQAAARGRFRGQAYTDLMALPDGTLQHTEFYQSWCRPQGIHGLLGANVIDDERGIVLLGLGRAGTYREDEVAAFDRAMPELRRVLGLRLRLLQYDLERARLRALLDLVRAPLLLVDESGCLLHANRAADALLKEGDALRLSQGRLAAATQSDTDALRRLLRAACSRTGGGSLQLSLGDGSVVGVMVNPLRADHGWAEGRERCAAVLVTNAPNQTEAQVAALHTFYGLTPMEAQVAIRVSRGEGLPAAAGKLGIRVSTARTHLHRVFDKTGAQRQSQLAWLFQSLPNGAAL
jgi:DNA-binding CsgD family transcriptional regulator/PAS domain-containing protein